jgi:protocatechuate 3,4-dioxygenase beta subunit
MTLVPNRRRFLTASAATGVALGIGGAAWGQTPACHDGDEPTLHETEGPFFKPRSPERADLIEPGMPGRPIVLAGLVVDRGCRPLAHALLDLWQADDAGAYDNTGFRLRGHQFTDADGRYRFRTIVPALYTGRTRHFHLKVQPAGGRLLTTQLYFPDEPMNRRDGLFRPELVMRVAKGSATGSEGSEAGDGLDARFDFVVEAR